MPRYDDVYKGSRYIVDTVDGGRGRWRYESTVDGKKPLIGEICTSEPEAREQGVRAARDKIDAILASYKR